MSEKREALEKQIETLEERIKNAPKNTPKEVLNAWRDEYDSLSFELNNLYDDYIND